MVDVAHVDLTDEPRMAGTAVRWSAVFSGAVIGLAVAVLGAMLFLALAIDTGTSEVRDNLTWWLAGTAIAATFVGAFLAGLIAGPRGVGAGLAQGVTLWGVLVAAVVAAAVPILAAVGTTITVNTDVTTFSFRSVTFWSAFWTLVIGLGAAAIGGLLGGIVPRATRPLGVVRTYYPDQRAPVTAEATDVEPHTEEPIPV